MTLKEQLVQATKTAMKQRDQLQVATLRLLQANIKNREIELGKDLDDAETAKVILSAVKQHKESIEQFQKGGRDDLVQKETAELRFLESYLPKQMSEEEITALVKEAIAAVGAASMKDIGNVMKYIMPKTQGLADGKLINQIVKQQLT